MMIMDDAHEYTNQSVTCGQCDARSIATFPATDQII